MLLFKPISAFLISSYWNFWLRTNRLFLGEVFELELCVRWGKGTTDMFTRIALESGEFRV